MMNFERNFYRGKRVDNGEWVYGFYVPVNYAKPLIVTGEDIDDYSEIEFDDYYHVNDTTVGQYTGLPDKNSKKIFEGDIIKIVPDCDYSDDYSISNVYSYNGILCVDYHGDDFDSTALGFLVDYLPDGDFEVIGNIHDNPELLEVEE